MGIFSGQEPFEEPLGGGLRFMDFIVFSLGKPTLAKSPNPFIFLLVMSNRVW